MKSIFKEQAPQNFLSRFQFQDILKAEPALEYQLYAIGLLTKIKELVKTGKTNQEAFRIASTEYLFQLEQSKMHDDAHAKTVNIANKTIEFIKDNLK